MNHLAEIQSKALDLTYKALEKPIKMNPKCVDAYDMPSLPIEERKDKIISCASTHQYCEGCQYQRECEKELEG